MCVIGDRIRRELFAYQDPVGQSIFAKRFGNTVSYHVVGVLAPVETAGAPARGVEERNLNREIFIPYGAAESRYSSRKSSMSRISIYRTTRPTSTPT